MTKEKTKSIKAVSLISGGLDSLLSTKLLIDQGIHLEGINFLPVFVSKVILTLYVSKKKDKAKRNNALWVAEQLGVKLHIIDVIEEYRDVLLNPKYGYGKKHESVFRLQGFYGEKSQRMDAG